MTLSWTPSTDNTAVTGYRTYLNGNQVGTPPSTSYGYGNLSCGTTYTLGVAAVDAAGNVSGIATLAKQTAACADTTPPSAPGTLTGTAASSAEIDLSWGAATDNVGVTGYQIWRCQGAGCTTYSQLTQTTGIATTYKDLSTAPATTYSYQIRALDAAGNTGPYTNSAQATTPEHAASRRCTRSAGWCPVSRERLCCKTTAATTLPSPETAPFKFATKLLSGAAYSVTVKTSPSGQSCTVSNATGTVASTDVSSCRCRMHGGWVGERLRRFQPSRWRSRRRLGRDQRRRPHDLVACGGRIFSNRRGHASRGNVRRRSVLGGRGDVDAVDGRAVGRTGRTSAEQRPRYVSRDLLLEQRQP